MKVEELAKKLKEQGFKVSYYKRKEGGARISSINGKAFKGSAGNKEARKLLGTNLSEKQTKHLKLIKTQKGQWGGKNPFKEKTKEVNEAFKQAVKEGRFDYAVHKRTGKKRKAPRVSYAKVKYRLEKEGKEAVETYLKQALRYAKGYAYEGALEVYKARLEADISKIDKQDSKRDYNAVKKVIDAVGDLIRLGLQLKETDFQELESLTYSWEDGLISAQDFKKGAIELLKRTE